MSGPIIGNANKVTPAPKYFSAPEITARVEKLELLVKDLQGALEETRTNLDEQLILVKSLHDKLRSSQPPVKQAPAKGKTDGV
jgi:hypothetical protein